MVHKIGGNCELMDASVFVVACLYFLVYSSSGSGNIQTDQCVPRGGSRLRVVSRLDVVLAAKINCCGEWC